MKVSVLSKGSLTGILSIQKQNKVSLEKINYLEMKQDL